MFKESSERWKLVFHLYLVNSEECVCLMCLTLKFNENGLEIYSCNTSTGETGMGGCRV